MLGVACLALMLALVLALHGAAGAQEQSEVFLGYGGAIVADAWNPVRVVSRNAGPAVLEITVDQGSLREGEIPFRYRAELPGGTGLATFADDVYLPAWRTLQWRLSSEDRLLVSGSISARDSDTRPLHLLVSLRPGNWRGAFGSDARVLERNGPDLPSRAAAYDGVATVVVDGTTAPPRPEALLAAAATGATVVLVGTLPASYADVELVAPSARTSYGNGVVIRAGALDAGTGLDSSPRVDNAALQGVIAEHLRLEPPETIPTSTILFVSAAYSLAVLVALRFGRLPGVAAALVLATMMSFAAWTALRPDQTSYRVATTLEVGSGGIASLMTLTKLLTLPAADMRLGSSGRPLEPRRVNVVPGDVHVPLERWGRATLVAPPLLGTPRLEWNGPRLVNRSGAAVEQVFVVGLGPQGTLAAGSDLLPSRTEDAVLPAIYEGLLEHLSPGSVLALAGDDVILVLADGGEL